MFEKVKANLDQVLEEELATTMRLLGVTNIKDLKPDHLELLDGLIGKRLGQIN
jgi:isopentenyl diphosphate isomerase/L-lactate dehydrogenase-like FMN-dependent dehydrogenase